MNFRPAKVTGFEGYKITNVGCGSSHSIAWAELNVAPQMLFSPIPLKHSRDPLGTMYVNNEFEEKKAEENVGQLMRRLRSSLSRYVLELRTDEEKRKSLDLILESLRVCYARDALIKVLGDITRNAVENAEADDESKAAQGSQSNASPCALNAKEENGVVLSLANIKLLVSLLKLGLSNRLNEKQCEELTMILIHNAKQDKEVSFGSILFHVKRCYLIKHCLNTKTHVQLEKLYYIMFSSIREKCTHLSVTCHMHVAGKATAMPPKGII